MYPVTFPVGILAQLIESVGDPSKEAWIAVDFDDDSSLPRDFVLGDSRRSRHNFINRPLRTTQTYRVFVRALGHGSVTSHSTASWLCICDILPHALITPNESPGGYSICKSK